METDASTAAARAAPAWRSGPSAGRWHACCSSTSLPRRMNSTRKKNPAHRRKAREYGILKLGGVHQGRYSDVQAVDGETCAWLGGILGIVQIHTQPHSQIASYICIPFAFRCILIHSIAPLPCATPFMHTYPAHEECAHIFTHSNAELKDAYHLIQAHSNCIYVRTRMY